MAYRKDFNQEPDEQAAMVSKINSAGIINITLENLWRDCYSAMAKGDLQTWNRKLDAIWVILGGDVEEGKDEDKKLSEINMQIYKTGSLNYSEKGFKTLDENKSQAKALQYILLNKKSLFLRRLQNSQGKGTAYASDDDDDFD